MQVIGTLKICVTTEEGNVSVAADLVDDQGTVMHHYESQQPDEEGCIYFGPVCLDCQLSGGFGKKDGSIPPTEKEPLSPIERRRQREPKR